jgi:hypothetical protein
MKSINDRVRIVPSDELASMRLSGLAGRRGKVAEQVSGAERNHIGYMVCLNVPYQGECLWFVPENALEDDTDSE